MLTIGATDFDDILSKIRYMIIGCNCKWIVVDHLHMLVMSAAFGDERTTIDNIMGSLSRLVEETNVGMILVSHLRRVEGNKGHEQGVTVGLSHLRGSASIAQVSDCVIALERDQQSEDPQEANTTHMRVLKSRYTGDVGMATHLLYDKDSGRLREVFVDESSEELGVMKSLVFDIETDGLDAKKIWCISALDVDTEQQYSYGPSELSEGFDMLLKADKLIGHNIIGFDIPVINKLTGLNLMDKELVDTLVLSRLFNPVREGNHGLERWGYALGSPKIEFDQYDSYSVEMLKYCEQDVYLNYQVYKALKKESKGFSRQSVVLEHETNKILSQQRDHGFLFDVEEATKLLGVLNSRLAEIVNKINECFKPKQEVRKIFRGIVLRKNC